MIYLDVHELLDHEGHDIVIRTEESMGDKMVQIYCRDDDTVIGEEIHP